MKSRTLRIPTPQVQTTYNKVTKTYVTTTNRPNGYGENFTVLADVTNGDFVTVNSHEFTKMKFQDHLGFASREDSVEVNETRGWIHGQPNWPTPGPSSWDPLFNSALSVVYDKVRSGEVGSGLDLSVSLAEAGQARRLFTSSAKLLAEFARSPLRTAVKSLSTRELSSRWLEYRLGWAPLIGDVYSTFDALMHRRLYALHRVTGTARTREYQEWRVNAGPYPASTMSCFNDNRSRCLVEALFSIPSSVRNRLAGYTSLNPASILWELTPWSFVVDYVIDIGGYLRNLESAVMYSSGFVNGYYVYGYKQGCLSELRCNSSTGGVKTLAGGLAWREMTYKNRRRLTTATVFPRTPRFTADLGWKQLVTTASLLRQQIKR